MPIKVYLQDNIHRLAKLPESLPALIVQINSLFKDELPASWKLQYLDSDGDLIALTHDHDYKELLELESSTPGISAKIYIVPKESEPKDSSYKPAKYPSFEEYEVIKTSENVQKEGIISQNEEEKTANAEQVTTDHSQNFEVKPQVSQPKKEDKKDKKQCIKAEELLKKFISGKYPEITKEQIDKEFDSIREALTEEQKQKFDKKRAKIEEKFSKNREKADKSKKFDKYSKEFELSKFLRIFRKAFKAQNQGDVEKIAKCKGKLLAFLPEAGKQTLEELFINFPQDVNKDEAKRRFVETTRKLVEESFPERKDEILHDFESFIEKKNRKLEKKELCLNENKNKELKEKPNKIALKKAKILKMVFPEEEITKLRDYVSQKPEDLSMEELVLNYRKDVGNV